MRMLARWTSSASTAAQRSIKNLGIWAGLVGGKEEETKTSANLDQPDFALSLVEHELFVRVWMRVVIVGGQGLEWLLLVFDDIHDGQEEENSVGRRQSSDHRRNIICLVEISTPNSTATSSQSHSATGGCCQTLRDRARPKVNHTTNFTGYKRVLRFEKAT